MKKYLIKDTGEPLTFGDIIEIALTKETESGTIVKETECRFTKESIPFLLDLGVIEEQHQSYTSWTWQPSQQTVESLLNDFLSYCENFNERLTKLESKVK